LRSISSENSPPAIEPHVGMIVAYHPAANEGLGHAVRPAMITEASRSGEECHLVLAVFLTDGRLVVRSRPAHAAAAMRHGGYWDFLPRTGGEP
jgi:hypothetical protein